MSVAKPIIREQNDIEDLIVERNVIFDCFGHGTSLSFGRVNPSGIRHLGYMGKDVDEPTIESIASVSFSEGQRDKLVERIRDMAGTKGFILEQKRYNYRTSYTAHLPPLNYQIFVPSNGVITK